MTSPRRRPAVSNDESGFTLIELMIIMSLIGLLAMIGLASFENFKTYARRSACVAHQRHLSGPGILYGIENSLENVDVTSSVLVTADLIPPQLGQCPEGAHNGTADYIIEYGVGQMFDIDCDVMGVAHDYSPQAQP